jgi:hypothetical protein
MLQIKRYYQFKQKHSNLYDGLVPTKKKNIFDQNILTVLPNRDQFGRRVLILELGSESLSHSPFSEEQILANVQSYKTINSFATSAKHMKKITLCVTCLGDSLPDYCHSASLTYKYFSC